MCIQTKRGLKIALHKYSEVSIEEENSAFAHFYMLCGLALDTRTTLEIYRHSTEADSYTAEVPDDLMKRIPDVVEGL
ncbi:MAG: hypothetical protein FIB08_11285 [Candidatus Methanoperedens sp.]|nr:hypothetical protein [Candidatus Methanoperedens sp.]